MNKEQREHAKRCDKACKGYSEYVEGKKLYQDTDMSKFEQPKHNWRACFWIAIILLIITMILIIK